MNQAAHPLTLAFLAALPPAAAGQARRVLVVGVGSGRNLPPLLDAGLVVDAVEEDAERGEAVRRRFADHPGMGAIVGSYDALAVTVRTYDGALSTHAYLHGRRATVAAGLRALADVLRADAAIALTLGSTRDPRCGAGEPVEPGVWRLMTGEEIGVAHLFLAEMDARTLLEPDFTIERIDERESGALVGRWAHGELPPDATVHWFVLARRRAL